ncbi:hypothetical protein [Pararhizobium sp. IMCC21322]|uniref:hypothetical protein n=1 Tax=Pararhizobium sp. IMCC21322 TaxID=3067903 RepID=UPI002741BA8A|nr:hypothetical protein [Pararhizobium sp. IMCC21322]
MLIRLLIVSVIALNNMINIAVADDYYYILAAERWQCIANNAEGYLQSQRRGLIYIAVDHCPIIPADPIRAVSRNENPSFGVSDAAQFDMLLTFSIAEFECLINQEIPQTAKALTLLYDQCKITVGN